MNLIKDLTLRFDGFCIFVPTFVLAIIVWKLLTRRRENLSLPPGPRGLPIIGNLHQISIHHPHLSLHHLAHHYGPIIHLRLGQVPTVVISSAEAAKCITKANDLAISNRPTLYSVKHLFYNCNDLGFAPYGPFWRGVKKLCTIELFSSKRVQSFEHVRREVVCRLDRRIGSFYPQPFDVSEQLGLYANDVLCRATFGRVFSDKGGDYHRYGFYNMLYETQIFIGGFCVGDLFPSLEWISIITGLKGRLDRLFKRFDTFFDELIQEHLVTKEAAQSKLHLLQLLLNSQKENDGGLDVRLTMDNVKAIIMDIFVAGTDTTFITLDWAMTEMMMNERVLQKGQTEVRKLMGQREWVSDSDVANMDYLKAIVKEVFRLHPPAPLLMPRESMDQFEINGYKIPPKTRVFFNAWAIGRDPAIYSDPNEFRPERFIGSSVDYKGQHFELVPFGMGRRICPAILFGEANVMLALAQLLHSFDWKFPAGIEAKDLDMTEVFGITMHRAQHLQLVAQPRFSNL